MMRSFRPAGLLTAALLIVLGGGADGAIGAPTAPLLAPGQVVIDPSEIGHIIGRVTRAPGGEAAPATRIELLRPSLAEGRVFPEPWVPLHQHANPVVLARLLSAPDGSFRLDGLAAADYIVRCTEAPSAGGSASASIRAEEPVQHVELVLDLGRTAMGTVLVQGGEPLAQAFVFVAGIDLGDGLNSAPQDGSAPWTRSESDGRFRLTQLPAGTLHLQAAHSPLGFSKTQLLAAQRSDDDVELHVYAQGPPMQAASGDGGIGVSLRWTNRGPTLSRLLHDLPAYRAGLLVGDEITEIDALPTRFMSSVEFVARCRGPVGSTVNLQIYRGDQTLEVSIQRALLSP